MTTTAGEPRDVDVTVRSLALITVGILWLVVAGLIAVVIRLGVPTPEELLRDVADRRTTWIASNVVLIVQQAVLALAAPAIIDASGRAKAASASTGMLLMAGGAFTASGVVHGVFGAHLASKVGAGPIDTDLVTDSELFHALGDTFWFVGVGAMLAATSAASLGLWISDHRDRRDRPVAVLGAAAVGANLLQFGWFVDHVFGVFAAPGTLLQAAWLAVFGLMTVRQRSPAA